MQSPYRKLGMGGVDQNGDFDLGGRNRADIDALVGERLEGARRHPGMRPHADADDRDLADVGRPFHRLEPDRRLRLLQRLARALVIGGRHGEGDVGEAVRGNILHDHIDVDVLVGERSEKGSGDPRLVGEPPDRDLRIVLRERDAGDNLIFQNLLLIANERADRLVAPATLRIIRVFETRTHEKAYLLLHRKLDRADLQHLGAERGHLQHLLEGDLVEALRLLRDVGIGRIDAVDVGVDVAAVGVDRGGDRHRARVGTAAAEGGDAAGLLMNALEAGNHRHLVPLLEALDQLVAIDPDDVRGRVRAVGINRNLPALPGARDDSHSLQDDREKPRRDLFAGGDHGVVFARVMQHRRLAAQTHELVGGAGHGRDHDGHVVSGVDLTLDVAGDVADAVDIGDGRAAELHDEPGHEARVSLTDAGETPPPREGAYRYRRGLWPATLSGARSRAW